MVRIATAILLLLILTSTGCGSSARDDAQKLDPAEAASRVLAAYDVNGDDNLAPDELGHSLALVASASRIDRDGDGTLSRHEIQTRFEALEAQADYVALSIHVTADGKPLIGANVTLAPEPFMGDDLQSYSGTTVEGGACPLRGEKKEVPGLPVGFYRVRIASSDAKLDESRGCEIADDVTGNRLRFDL